MWLFTDEKVNFITMTVLGLRLLFLKTVVFNVLMTLRLWMSRCEYTDSVNSVIGLFVRDFSLYFKQTLDHMLVKVFVSWSSSVCMLS